jgi:DNA-binding CsgD family transcriptional regulator
MADEECSELIGLIYDAALDPSAWPAMLNRLADSISALGAQVGSYNSRTNAIATIAPRTDPEYLRSFTEYWANRNPIWKRSGRVPVGEVMVPEMVISRDEFCRTDFYNEWSKPQRIEARIATNLLVEGPISTVISAHRPYSKGDFDTTETKLFASLISHLQRAVQMQLRLAGLGGLTEGSAEILNRLTVGVLLVDAEARVLFANQVAEDLLRARRGLLRALDGLRAEVPEEASRLRRIIADCAAPWRTRAGGRLRLSREHGLPLTVIIAPHRSRLGWIDVVRPRAMLFISDPEAGAVVRLHNLLEDFGLTPAEAAITAELVNADGLHAVAERLGVSVATVRTHLAHIFNKTSTHRQSELIRLIFQDKPPVRADQDGT